MGGCSCEDHYECITPRTVVLVGKTGNGKSATGNSILGMKVLLSKRSSSGVTISSELQATTLADGQLLNVIDTPGLCDSSLDFESIAKEIVKCINLAQNGIDAFLVVVSTRSRFSEEEKAAISSLQTLFGRKVYDYMVVVFTGGDELEEDDQTLEDFLLDASEALKETLSLCENRYVLFDNKTKDETMSLIQVNKLLSLVNMVSTKNGGKPYTNEIFTEMKNQRKEVKELQEISVDDEKFKHIYEMIESKFKETTLKLERQLAEERASGVKADEKKQNAEKKPNSAKKKPNEEKVLPKKEDCVKAEKKPKAAAKKNSDDEIKMLKEKLQKSEKKNKELRQQKDEEMRRNEEHWRQREADLRRSWMGCFIM